MKPTKSILILLSLFLTFSCDDKEEELRNELSLDWILLKKVIDEEFYVESCDGYVEFNEDTFDEYVGINCQCNDSWDDECGGCRITPFSKRVNSCDGYELCGNYPYDDNCCYESIGEMDENGNNIVKHYYVYEYLFNEYLLYWNDDLNVCYDNSCDEEFVSNNDEIFDIVIPSHFPIEETDYCGDFEGKFKCDDIEFFHPNCDTPLDTTMMIGSKSVSFEKMGWLGREDKGYITYLRNEEYLQTDGDDIDISSYKIVDYQIKE